MEVSVKFKTKMEKKEEKFSDNLCKSIWNFEGINNLVNLVGQCKYIK